MRADRHLALLAALAQHRDHATGHVQVAPPQGAQLAQAQAGGIEQLEQRAVTLAQWRIGRHLDEPDGLVGIQHLRQLARGLGRTQRRCGTGRDAAMLEQPLVEAATGRQAPLQALGRKAAAMLGGDEAAQRFGLHIRQLGDAVRLRPLRQRGEITAVGIQCVCGDSALDFEVREEAGDGHDPSLPVMPANAGLRAACALASGHPPGQERDGFRHSPE